VSPGNILQSLSPYARLATAVAPFLAVAAVRLIFGRSRFTGVLLTVATVWFAANVLMTPYSSHMQRDIQSVRALFR
jgi:hypothetical protein